MARQQVPTRLYDPAASPQTSAIHADIYDKLNRLLVQSAPVAAAPAPVTPAGPTTTNISIVSISGATGTALAPQYAFIPLLTAVPSNNPTTGAPYAQDGLLIEYAPSTGDYGVFFRYDGSMFLWVYQDGMLNRTQAQLAGLATLLSTVHTGLLVYVTDYAHMLQWTGTAWQRGPGDMEHSDTFHDFGAAPSDTGWHALDGSTQSFLKYDGTLGSRVLPASTVAYAKSGAAYSATVTAAVVPTLAMASYTPAGTVSAPTFTGSPQSTATDKFTLDPLGSDALTSVSTPAGSISAPTFTGTPATLTGTISLPADPVAHFTVVRYYRQ